MSSPGIAQSVLWTGITIGCYLAGVGLRKATRGNPLANPSLVGIVLVATLLELTHTPYAGYFEATWILTFLLAPATVALGIPMARHFGRIRAHLRGVSLGLLAGSLSSMISGAILVRILGGSSELAMSMLPKAVTTPIAISVAGEIGGQPALTATLAISGGIIAAMTLRTVLGAIGVTHHHAVGLAAGTAGSGIAAAHAATMGEASAAFAAIGVGMNGLITALLASHVASMLR